MYCDVVDFVHRCASSECQEGYLPDVMGYEGGDRAAGRLHSSVCLFVVVVVVVFVVVLVVVLSLRCCLTPFPLLASLLAYYHCFVFITSGVR